MTPKPCLRFLVIAALALSANSAGGQPAYRVKDLKTTPSRFLYLTSGFTRLGDALYFSASDPSDSGQLWKTDGTAAGTGIVRQTPNPSPFTTGYSPEKPAYLTPAGEFLFFSAPEESNGFGLWKTDGTIAGTALVKNNGPATAELTAVGGRVFFRATDGAHGYELWTSDGTDAGTQMVKDINLVDTPALPGYGSYPQHLLSFKGRLYFTASSDGAKRLWSSDGTESGTVPVKQLGAALIGFGGDATDRAVGSERFFFFEGTSLWSSDGTESGTHSVGPFSLSCAPDPAHGGCSYPYLLGVVGGTALFIAPLDSGHPQHQLWRSDGTSEGTYPLLAVDWNVFNCVISSEAAYFVIDGHVNAGLWRSDGTPAGTTFIAGISSGTMSWTGNALYLAGYDGTKAAVWKSDGTPGGTIALVTVQAGCSFDSISVLDRGSFAELNGSVYFVMSCGLEGPVLWRTDGTAEGTEAVGPLPGGAGTAGSSLASLTAAGGTVVFAVDESSPSQHFRLWRSDGTESGTFSLATTLQTTLNGQHAPELPAFSVLGGMVFFSGGDGTFGQELWRTDGTPDGTRLIADIVPGGTGSSPIPLGASHGVMLFSAWTGPSGNRKLWRTDGTVAGTLVVQDDVYPLLPIVSVAGDTYYTNWNGFLHELWRTDGTASGTVLVKSISRGWFGVTLDRVTAAGGHIYFVVATPGSSTERFDSLYESDGTEAGTYAIHQAPFVTVAPYFRGLTAAGDVLYYGVDDAGHKTRDYSPDLTRCDALWKRDPVTHLNDRVKNFAEAPGGFFLCDLVEFHGMVYLAASDGTHGLELWQSDGTEAGTFMVKDINPGPAGSSPTSLKVIGNSVLFAASDGEHGKELWSSNGTAEGTRMLQDIHPGPGSSGPSDFTLAGNRIFFVADDGLTGREPWAMPASEVGIAPTISRPRRPPALPPRGGP